MANVSPSPEPAADEIGGLAGFFAKFTVLKGAMRELWVVFGIKILIIAAYGIMNSTLVLWFSSDFGLSDQKALGLVAAWSLIMSIGTVLSGSLTDVLGFRTTFYWGIGLSVVSRVVMAFSTNLWVALLGGLLPLAIGEALTGPVLVAAVRTFSTPKQRSISFSIIYSVMNAGFFVGHRLFDYVRRGLGEHGHFGVAGAQITTYQTLFLVSAIIDCVVIPFLFFLREGAEATDQGVRFNPKKVVQHDKNAFIAASQMLRDTAKDTGRMFAILFKQTGFYRLLIFLLLIAFLKLIYRQLDYVFPKFGIRTLGDGAPIGTLLAINDIIIVFLTPFVGALTQRFSAYRMVILGGIVSSGSIFIMAIPALFGPLANSFIGQWFGHWYLSLKGPVDPAYLMIGVFVVVLSFGEAIYSPRVYEYAAAIAPKGQEASYSALSYVPILLSKLLTGTFSGTLLATYCPEHGVRHPEMMWLFIGVASAVAPICLIALARVIRLKEQGRDD